MTLERAVHYLSLDGGSVAVTEIGSGSPTIVVAPGPLSHVDALWDDASYARWMWLLAETNRVVTYDPVGLGASGPALEGGDGGRPADPVQELEAVVGACADEVVVAGWLSGCGPARSLCGRDRVQKVILYAPYDVPPVLPWSDWGSGAVSATLCPSRAREEIWGRLERATATPNARSIVQGRFDLGQVVDGGDAVALLPTRVSFGGVDAERAVPVDSADAIPWGDAAADVARYFVEAAGGTVRGRARRRALLAVMVSDIVGSTDRATSVAGVEWKHNLETHDSVVAARVGANGGAIGRHTGDGVVATFPLASDAMRCAAEVAEEARRVGLPARVGVHVGEVDMEGETPDGMTVRIANRVASMGGAGQVVISATARDAVAGVHFAFEHLGVCSPDGRREVETFLLLWTS